MFNFHLSLSHFIYSTLISIILILTLTNPNLGLCYIINFLNPLFLNRFTIDSFSRVNESLFVQYNGLILILGFLVLIHFSLFLFYLIISVLKLSSNKLWLSELDELDLQNIQKKLKLILVLGLIPILGFIILLHFYYRLPIEFVDYASLLHEKLYNKKAIVYFKFQNYPLDHIIYWLGLIGQWWFGYLTATILIAHSHLVEFKPKLKLVYFDYPKNFDFHLFLNNSLTISFIMIYVKMVMKVIFFWLGIIPYKNYYLYRLIDLVNLSSLSCNLYLLSLTVIIISIILIYHLEKNEPNLNQSSHESNHLRWLFPTRNSREILLIWAKVNLSIFYFSLILTTLIQFTHYIPSMYLSMSYLL